MELQLLEMRVLKPDAIVMVLLEKLID